MAAPDTTLAPLTPETIRRLRELTDRFTDVGTAERANYQLYLTELCEAIGVERQRLAASSAARAAAPTAYQFECPVQTITCDGVVGTNFIDLFRAGCFALEAKDSADGASTTRLLTKAFGQVVNHARDLADRPPYIMVVDVGRSLTLWDRWQGTYGGYHLGARMDLRAFIERRLRRTVEEPVRERWTAVQAEEMQVRERGRPVGVKAAESRLLELHGWLRGLRILDPACCGGNFRYVTMHALKRVEVEMFRLLSEVQGGQISTRMDEIDPGEFHAAIVLYRGTLDRLVVPVGWFSNTASGVIADPAALAVVDFGQTVRLGRFGVSADAILHEFDDDYRKR